LAAKTKQPLLNSERHPRQTSTEKSICSDCK